MIEYDFEPIIDNIPDVIAYKRRHYYDDPFGWKLTRERTKSPVSYWIHVRDYDGKEGTVTPRELYQLSTGRKPQVDEITLRAVAYIYHPEITITNNKMRALVQAIKDKFELVEVVGYENKSRKTMGISD